LEILITSRSSQTPATWFAENDPEGVAFEYEVLGAKEVAN